jgi:splicing factor U2AF subunit
MIASAEVMVPNPTMSGINPQIQRQQRKIYVGNLPRDITELELLEFFNTAMLNANFNESEGSPCVSASINIEKNFAFVEFRTPEEASRAMSFDGITLRGIALRVRRPKDFIPDDGSANPTALAANLNIVSTNVADTPYKVFIGGLPGHLNEGDVKKLLSMFGQLRSFNLVRDTHSGHSKGYAFCEFADHGVTDMACAALNGMAVGDKNLVVQLASVDQRKKNLPRDGPERVGDGPLNSAAGAFLNLNTPASQILASHLPSPDQTPTKILVIMNMINITDYPGNKSEEEYQEFCDAVYEEISKYSKVKKMLVPRPPKMYQTDSVEQFDLEKFKSAYDSDDEQDVSDPWSTPGFGKVYVEFNTPEEARKAQTGLAGRRFDGRMIITSFLPEDKWERGLLEPEDESAAASIQGMQLLNETQQKELQELQALLNQQALEVAQADISRLAREGAV